MELRIIECSVEIVRIERGEDEKGVAGFMEMEERGKRKEESLGF